jgi:hypothetical protein
MFGDDYDPGPIEVRREFIRLVEAFHEEHDFEHDCFKIIQKLDIPVDRGGKNFHVPLADGGHVISIEEGTVKSREVYTGWHELCHHIFQNVREGALKAYLDSYLPTNVDFSKNYEEELCHEGARVLQMPRAILSDIIENHGANPLAVFELSRVTGASHTAAMIRVARSLGIDMNAILLLQNGRVIASVSNAVRGKVYSTGNDFVLHSAHPLRVANFQPGKLEQFRSTIPFKSSQAKIPRHTLAAQDPRTGRILAFFTETPDLPTPTVQDSLFGG